MTMNALKLKKDQLIKWKLTMKKIEETEQYSNAKILMLTKRRPKNIR